MGLALGDVSGAAQGQQAEGPLGPWVAGLQGRWDEKQGDGLNELPLWSELWEVPIDLGWHFCFLPGNRRRKQSEVVGTFSEDGTVFSLSQAPRFPQ